MMAKKIIVVLLVSLFMAITGVLPSHAVVKPGDEAAAFSLGNPVSGGNFDFNPKSLDKPVVLVFFNTTCGACDSEINFLKGLVEEQGGKFDVVLAAVDGTQGSKQAIISYVMQKGIKATTVWDKDFDTGEKYGFSFSPATVGIGKDGKVVFIKTGFSREDRQSLKTSVEGMLK
jgi:thiol-disulfide isomerase/thioredoxin